MKNNYGNYVIQKALKLACGDKKSLLIKAICHNLNKLGERKLIAKWKSIISPHIRNNNDIKNDMIIINSPDEDKLSF
jgi:hypothetical protein